MQQPNQPEVQKQLETLIDLFQHDGWKLFIEDFEKFRGSLNNNSYLECDTNDQWQQRRGSLVMLDQILSYQQTIENNLERMNETEAE